MKETTLATDWEEALSAFDASRVTLAEAHEAVAEYAPYDDAPYLMPDMSNEAKRAKMRALGAKSTSYLLSDLMASHFDGVGDHAAALSMRLRALPSVPRWSPDAASGMLAGIARELLGLGQVEAAARSARRALEWDPTHPGALTTIAEAAVRRDDAEEAFGILAYLDGIKYPKELGPGAVAQLAKDRGLKKPATVKAFAPSAEKLVKLDAERAAWAQALPPHGGPGRGLRHAALVAAASGRLALAHHAADKLASAPRWGMGAAAAADAAWNRAVAALVAGLPPGDEAERRTYARIAEAKTPRALADLIDGWTRDRDVAALEAARLDPNLGLSRDAGKALAALAAGAPSAPEPTAKKPAAKKPAPEKAVAKKASPKKAAANKAAANKATRKS